MSDDDVIFEDGGSDVPTQWASTPPPPKHVETPLFDDDQFSPSQPSRPVQRHTSTDYGNSYSDEYSAADNFRVGVKRDIPQMGFRHFLADKLHIPVGKSKTEQEFDSYIAMINRSLLGQKLIGIMGGKGGVGKTSTTECIASILAMYRSHPVVAVTLDYNSTLNLRTKAIGKPARGDVSILEFATDKTIRTPNDIAGCMRNNKHRLSVLGTGLNPINHDQLTVEHFRRAIKMLKSQYELIFLDFGNIPNTEAFWEALKSLDLLIEVTSTENDSMQGINMVEGMAQEAGLHALLAEHSLTVVNYRSPATPKVDVNRFVSSIHGKRREVVEVPWDSHLAESGPVDLDLLDKRTRDQYILAAAIAMNRLAV